MNDPYKTPSTDASEPSRSRPDDDKIFDRSVFAILLLIAVSFLTIQVWIYIDKELVPFIGNWDEYVEILQGILTVLLFSTIGLIGLRKVFLRFNVR